MYHPKTWGMWLLAALLPVVLTKNPFYLLIAILAVGANYLILARRSATAQGWETFLRAGLILVLFSMLFNLLLVSAGSTVLFSLPKLRWQVTSFTQQPVLVQIGGTVTLESLIYGLTTGLALLGVLVTFATFNTLVDHYQLLRSIPRFLYQSAIVTSIGITFVPHMMVAQREIREAQALRGHRFRFIRDLPPLFIALLAEGLERSITLAESMEARGFGSAGVAATRGNSPAPASLRSPLRALPSSPRDARPIGTLPRGPGWELVGTHRAGATTTEGLGATRRNSRELNRGNSKELGGTRGAGAETPPAEASTPGRGDQRPARSGSSSALLLKAVIALALVILTGGAFARSYVDNALLVAPMMLMGGIMLAAALWMVGQNVQRSRYRRDIWRQRDTLVTAASALAGLVILATWVLNRRALIFYPYPRIEWPDFSPWIALSLLLLAMPALATRLTGEPLGEIDYD